MNIDDIIQGQVVENGSDNIFSGAMDIAIRDAEFHGTKLVIQRDGKIEELTPEEVRLIRNKLCHQ